jgi:dienelactone hydrolase
VGIVIALVFMAFADSGVVKGAEVSIKLPAPSGPYAVGRELFDWTDSKRPDPFEASRRRELMVWIWYPARHNAASQSAAEYLPGKWGHSAARREALDMRIRSGPLWSRLFMSPISAASIERIQIHAIDSAPVGDVQMDRFPVLLFSPGLGKMPTDYTATIEDIVSHGYIVVGVNPTYFVSNTTFQNGRTAGNLPLLLKSGGDGLTKLFPIWVNDLRFVADRVTELAIEGRDDLARKLDVSRMGAFGHSYGGAAALALCRLDSRIVAAIDWDGTPRGDRTPNSSKPVMFMHSDHGPDGGSLHYYSGVQTGFLMTIHGVLHRGFSDEVAYPLPTKMREDLVGTLDAGRMVLIASTYTRAFFGAWLRNRRAPLLCGPDPAFTEVSIRRRGAEALCGSAGP